MNPTLEEQGTNSLAIKKAWEEFVDTGHSTRSTPRQLILDSWRQSRDKGIDPNIQRASTALEQSELDEQINNNELGIVGKSVLERVADSTFNTKHIMVLANAEGQILYSVGHKAVQAELEQINFMPGGSWDIDQVGPNGVGTPIAFDKPELIYGSEHYCEAWQPWACYGSPIHNLAGDVIGAIDITGPANHLSMQTMSLAVSLAHSVESELNVMRLQKREQLRQLYRERKFQLSNVSSCLIDSLGCVLECDQSLMNFFAGQNLSKISKYNLQTGIWDSIESILHKGISDELLININENKEIRFIIEPIMESNVCLGAILIQDSFFEHSNFISTNQTIDFKSQGDQMIKEALEKTNGNISKAARILGINRTTIYRRLKLLKSN